MKPQYSTTAEEFRVQVRAFLGRELPADFPGLARLPIDEVDAWIDEWRAILHRERYLAPGWPAEYGGGGLSALEQVVLAEEFALAGVPTGGPN
ncbi:MAG: acyl-CoA dehydrogenase, partial [Gammaproteobacteria bacterium]|nr:acyl-CoA dehydrogenase [Gammaproteobacteria bacterium]